VIVGEPDLQLNADAAHGGLGISVDQLVMLLTGHNIRETLPFPMVRPTAG
jgi:lysyl-tRNA synthetase class II